MFIYTENTKQSDIQIDMFQVNQFAVFGFNSNGQEIINSHIFVKINYSILTGALICLECDINIQNSSLQFIASGLQLSALIIKSIKQIELKQSNISYRFDCNYSSGIVNQINSVLNTFNIDNVILIGYNNDNILNGYICSKLFVNTNINISVFSVCVNNMKQNGISEFSLSVTGVEIITCESVCTDNKIVTYGICFDIIPFSTILDNYTQVCNLPLILDQINNVCVCIEGYYFSVDKCVNIEQQFVDVDDNMSLLALTMQFEISQAVNTMNLQLSDVETKIYKQLDNISQNMDVNLNNIEQDILSTNTSLHKALNTNQDNINANFGKVQTSQLAVKDQITQFKSESIYKVDNVNQAVLDLKSLSSTRFTQLDSQISILEQKISSMMQSVLNTCSKETTSADIKNFLQQMNTNLINENNAIKTQINQLNAKINELSVNISIQTSGCKTVGATPEGDGLCKCTQKLGSLPNILNIENVGSFDGQGKQKYITYSLQWSKNYFSPKLNLCCTQQQYITNYYGDYDNRRYITKIICGDGLEYQYEQVEEQTYDSSLYTREYTNLPSGIYYRN
ncbi:Hypothetical_protein [Hexamita inflata]|uniref:Hypothetical_protein n=1 Tax=Hexamita inflata TaxID=28002 RepID=A0AA86UCJ5_9EUKA|nr:Hypothetical protein HINF_LOCUS40275 [Hexamita inflata]